MSSTPTDLLVLNGPEDTVLLGYRGTPGLAGLEPVLRNDSEPASGLMRSLSWVPTDPAQHLKLRNFLLTQSPAQAMPSNSYTVSFNATGSHGSDPVMAQLHHRLDSGRIRALRVRRHARIEHVRPVVASAVSSPVPDAGRAAVAAAGIVGWTATERVEALIRDSLPFLGADLRREIEALLTAKGLAEMAGMIIALAAVQAIPVVGEALDAALMGIVFVYAGFSGLKAIGRLIVLVRKTLAAHSEAEIAALAPDAAKAIETLGSACLLALGARWKGRSPEAAGGVPAGDAVSADTVPLAHNGLGFSPYPLPRRGTVYSQVDGEGSNLSAGVRSPPGLIDPLGLRSKLPDGPTETAPIQWPPNRGFLNDPVNTTIPAGYRVSRYGGFFNDSNEFVDKGTFVAPESVPYPNRALAPGTDAKPYSIYELEQPIEDVLSGPAAPWFGEEGMGTQHELPLPVQHYIDNGTLKLISRTIPGGVN